MELLNTLQDNERENCSGQYFMRTSNYHELMHDTLFLSQVDHHSESLQSGHVVCNPSDPYNRFADHVLVYDQATSTLMASARIIAAVNRPLAGFQCETSFDISSVTSLKPDMIELSDTFVSAKCDNKAQALLKIWHGVLELIYDYEAKYIIGTLGLPMQITLENRDVFSLQLPVELMLDECEFYIWAREHVEIEALTAGQLIHPNLLIASQRILAMNGKIGKEAHIESGCINLFVLVHTSRLNDEK